MTSRNCSKWLILTELLHPVSINQLEKSLRVMLRNRDLCITNLDFKIANRLYFV